MDFQKKLFAYVLLIMSAFMLWNVWQQEHAPKQVAVQEEATQHIVQATDSDEVIPDIPAVHSQTLPVVKATPTHTKSQMISVKTDVLNLNINTNDGNLVKSELLHYPVSLKEKDTPTMLLNNSEEDLYEAQTGLINSDGTKLSPIFTTSNTHYDLAKDQDELAVNLTWVGENGLKVIKTYTFHRGKYRVDVNYALTNTANKTWTGHYFSQIVRRGTPPESADISRYTFFGAAISSPDKHYDKIKFSSMLKDPVSQSVTNGWVAMIQHYFVTAWVPAANQSFHYYSKASKARDLYTIGILSPSLSIAPGATVDESMTLYSGPAIAKNLDAVAPNLRLTIDYGFLWFISNILFWLMKHIYDVIGNWGWAIVLVTIVVKAVFYQLSAKSYKSMAAMKRLQPKIALLKERFKEDKQAFSKATMELYRKEKVNPLGGCLPILVQIPVFIALYWVIVESVQLRQAPFILWIHDLAVQDPYFVLPVIMGVTMFIQQKISPPPPDPVQAKMMLLLPVVFTIFFLQFPAGLVLYWIVNNSISITQQYFMMRKYGDKANFKKMEKANKEKQRRKK